MSKPYSEIIFKNENLQEHVKCSTDLQYFIEKHLSIPSEDGIKPFKLSESQKIFIDQIQEYGHVICEQKRQVGLTTAAIAYLIHALQFKLNEAICVILPNSSMMKHVMGLFCTMGFDIHKGIGESYSRKNSNSIISDNGNSIEFFSADFTSLSKLKGRKFSTIYLGDLSFVSNQEDQAEILQRIQYCSQRNPVFKLIIHSVDLYTDNLFTYLWKNYDNPSFRLKRLQIFNIDKTIKP